MAIENQENIRKLFGMDELGEVAQKIGSFIVESEYDGGVTIGKTPQIVEQSLGEKGNDIYGGFNCYPSNEHDSACHDLAVFVSLQSPLYATGRYHLSCREAFEVMVQHVQGTCSRQTQSVLFITDNWDARAYVKWHGNIQVVRQEVQLEIYILVDGKTTLLKV